MLLKQPCGNLFKQKRWLAVMLHSRNPIKEAMYYKLCVTITKSLKGVNMAQAMLTSRVDAKKKSQAQRILKRSGTNSSKVINKMLDRIVETGGISFLDEADSISSSNKKAILQRALAFVDSLPTEQHTIFDNMPKAEIKLHRASRRV